MGRRALSRGFVARISEGYCIIALILLFFMDLVQAWISMFGLSRVNIVWQTDQAILLVFGCLS